MKTAIQTLISQIENEINKEGNGSMAIGFDYGLKKAKQFAEELLEMEKEQKIAFAKLHVQKALKAVENEMILSASAVKHWYLPETIK
jgi:hypothetical protein